MTAYHKKLEEMIINLAIEKVKLEMEVEDLHQALRILGFYDAAEMVNANEATDDEILLSISAYDIRRALAVISGEEICSP